MNMNDSEDLKQFVESLIKQETEYETITEYYAENARPFFVETNTDKRLHICNSGDFILVGLNNEHKNEKAVYIKVDGDSVTLDKYNGARYTQNETEILNNVSTWPEPKQLT